MTRAVQAPQSGRHRLGLIASLLLSTCLCVALLLVRVAVTGSRDRWDMLWNLFLAWLPMVGALIAHALRARRSVLAWLVIVLCALIWLVLFPNAPYLVTDVMHLTWGTEAVPFWYDLVLLISFAWTGCFLGFASLLLIQDLVRARAGAVAGWTVALSVLTLCGFGVYLGRFLRWNSWDVLTNPGPLLWDILVRIRHPFAHLQTYAFSALFSAFLICAYLMIVSMAGFRQETPGQSSPNR